MVIANHRNARQIPVANARDSKVFIVAQVFSFLLLASGISLYVGDAYQKFINPQAINQENMGVRATEDLHNSETFEAEHQGSGTPPDYQNHLQQEGSGVENSGNNVPETVESIPQESSGDQIEGFAGPQAVEEHSESSGQEDLENLLPAVSISIETVQEVPADQSPEDLHSLVQMELQGEPQPEIQQQQEVEVLPDIQTFDKQHTQQVVQNDAQAELHSIIPNEPHPDILKTENVAEPEVQRDQNDVQSEIHLTIQQEVHPEIHPIQEEAQPELQQITQNEVQAEVQQEIPQVSPNVVEVSQQSPENLEQPVEMPPHPQIISEDLTHQNIVIEQPNSEETLRGNNNQDVPEQPSAQPHIVHYEEIQETPELRIIHSSQIYVNEASETVQTVTVQHIVKSVVEAEQPHQPEVSSEILPNTESLNAQENVEVPLITIENAPMDSQEHFIPKMEDIPKSSEDLSPPELQVNPIQNQLVV